MKTEIAFTVIHFQTRVQKDLDAVCGEGPPLLQHLQELPFLQAVIAEAQRIRPVVPVGIPHGAVQEGMLGGYRIPRGTMMIPLQWAVHMDSRHWPQPEDFDPTRFLDQEGRFFRPDAFMPFQTGMLTIICLILEIKYMSDGCIGF